MLTITITPADIAAGDRSNCFRCPAAIAVARATGDSEANVYDADFSLWIEAHSRHIRAPWEVREFVRSFDGECRPSPLTFTLPDLSNPAWKERCYCCEELHGGGELDDEGVCLECREAEDVE